MIISIGRITIPIDRLIGLDRLDRDLAVALFAHRADLAQLCVPLAVLAAASVVAVVVAVAHLDLVAGDGKIGDRL